MNHLYRERICLKVQYQSLGSVCHMFPFLVSKGMCTFLDMWEMNLQRFDESEDCLCVTWQEFGAWVSCCMFLNRWSEGSMSSHKQRHAMGEVPRKKNVIVKERTRSENTLWFFPRMANVTVIVWILSCCLWQRTDKIEHFNIFFFVYIVFNFLTSFSC
jgi:hypothetical protein